MEEDDCIRDIEIRLAITDGVPSCLTWIPIFIPALFVTKNARKVSE